LTEKRNAPLRVHFYVRYISLVQFRLSLVGFTPPKNSSNFTYLDLGQMSKHIRGILARFDGLNRSNNMRSQPADCAASLISEPLYDGACCANSRAARGRLSQVHLSGV
jgi:hypothetical protein